MAHFVVHALCLAAQHAVGPRLAFAAVLGRNDATFKPPLAVRVYCRSLVLHCYRPPAQTGERDTTEPTLRLNTHGPHNLEILTCCHMLTIVERTLVAFIDRRAYQRFHRLERQHRHCCVSRLIAVLLALHACS